MIGPFRGGRSGCVATGNVPGRPYEFYFGAVNGGVWKTVNAGRTWMPVSTASRSPRSARSPWRRRTRRRLRRQRRIVAARFGRLRQRHVQVDRRRQDVDARRPRRHEAHRQGRRRSAESERRVRRRDRALLRRAPRSRHLPIEGRRGDLEKVLYKNDSIGAIDVAIDPTIRRSSTPSLWNTRRPPLVHVSAVERPRRRHLQVDRPQQTWKQLTNGLPTDGFGRSGIASRRASRRSPLRGVDAGKGERPRHGQLIDGRRRRNVDED